MEQARQHFLRAIQHHPEFEDTQIALARILINLKEQREALPHLLAAVRANPTNEVSHFLLATVTRPWVISPSTKKRWLYTRNITFAPTPLEPWVPSPAGTGRAYDNQANPGFQLSPPSLRVLLA